MCIFGVPTKTTAVFAVFYATEDLKQNLSTVLAYLHCFFFFPLINSAEPLQFTVTLILPPSAIPHETHNCSSIHFVNSLFKNHLCETIS